MKLFILAFVIFGMVLFGMSVGVLFGNRRIRGSCGGANLGGKHGKVSCDGCSSDGQHCHSKDNAPLPLTSNPDV